jgi:hypothetical protein
MRQRTRRKWPIVLRNCLLGLLLAGLQLLVVGDALSFWSWSWPWWLYIGVGTLWYLLIPGWAGFLTARQRGDPNTGVGAGCLVGSIAIILALIAIGTVAVLMPPPECGIDCPDPGGLCRGADSLCPRIGGLLALLIVFETMGGTIATVLGGSIGEVVGLRHFALSYQRRKNEEKHLD